MTLASGTRLGPYEVFSPLGAGGMGEVYRARDTRLDRQVAVKVLPAHLTHSPELERRFEDEARAVSRLNHPGICALFDVGREGDTAYLVMELVEGKTLAERLAKGPLPLEEVLRLGIQIADALSAAHRQGIVHRDLKPGNVMLTGSAVKLLDFGLARYRAPMAEAEPSPLPTTPAEGSLPSTVTEKGAILGTYPYMSPEQLEGREADARGDVFALGCVLYEAAAGQRPFTGHSRASLIGSILKDRPTPLSELQPTIPAALDCLLRGCLAKDPDQRVQTAYDVKLQLEWIEEDSRRGAAPPAGSRPRYRTRLVWGLAGLALLTAGVAVIHHLSRAPLDRAPVRLHVLPPEGLQQVGVPQISPDGKTLAFAATDAKGVRQVWIRRLDTLETWPLAGTEGASVWPVWSPDSRFIAFATVDDKLKKAPVAGGPVQTICDAQGFLYSWGSSGLLLLRGRYAPYPILWVPAAGGVPKVAFAEGLDVLLETPSFLPDGRHFLYTQMELKGEWYLMVAGLEEEGAKRLTRCDGMARYAPPGFVVFVKDHTLVAQRFDTTTLELQSSPVPIVDRVAVNRSSARADFSVSDNGVLVYRGAPPTTSRFVWVDRSGRELGQVGPPADYWNSALSPDGSRFAVAIRDDAGGSDIWICNLDHDTSSRFTLYPGMDDNPVWSPDGSMIAFASERDGGGLFVKTVSGSQPAEPLLKMPDIVGAPGDWSRDARFIAVSVKRPTTQWDIWIVPTDRSQEPYAVAEDPAVEVRPVFSPDGRYLAYQSEESGSWEVYVKELAGRGGRWQVSPAGGMFPRWSADGRTIYYLNHGEQVVAVPVLAGADFSVGTPQPLFEIDARGNDIWFVYCDLLHVWRDGSRFLVMSHPPMPSTTPFTVVLDWDADLPH